METFVNITEAEMDDFLKKDKGWEKNRSGYEYVYDYHIPNYPIIVKVMSSISVNTLQGRNKGSDAIRVFAVRKDKNGKVAGGLLKAKRVYRTQNWRDHVRNLVVETIKKSKKIVAKT